MGGTEAPRGIGASANEAEVYTIGAKTCLHCGAKSLTTSLAMTN